jgi:CBS domain containing-hemolysin-like protein
MQPIPVHSFYVPLALFFVALAARAMFSFLETSITALRLFKLKELAKTSGRYDSLFQSLEKNQPRVLITILLANSLADAAAASLAAVVTERIFTSLHLSSTIGISVGIIFSEFSTVIFGEIIPKNLAQGRSENLFHTMLWVMNIIFYALYPIVTVVMAFSDFVVSRFSGKDKEKGSEWVSSEHEIRFLINYITQQGIIESEKKDMLENVFELGYTPVKEIMIPSTDIVSISVQSSIKEALEVFKKYQYTRLPVYEGQWDNIIGMVHQKDIFLLLTKGEEKELKDIVRSIIFIPESIKVNQLLREFRQQHMHIAIVLNEHGSMVGLITLEDVLEEIVGDISDEHEPTAIQKIVELKRGGWLIDASVPLEDLEETLKISFESEDSVTLGGFLTEQLQHLPKKGERVIYKGFNFQVHKASSKRVHQVLIFQEGTSDEDKELPPFLEE